MFNFRLQFLLPIKANQRFLNLRKSTKIFEYMLLGFSAVPVSHDQHPIDKTEAEGASVIFTYTHDQAIATSWTVGGQPFENFLGMWETILGGSRLTFPTPSGYITEFSAILPMQGN